MTFPASIQIRSLSDSAIPKFRDIRLSALTIHPESFGPTFEEENKLDHSNWLTRIGSSDSSDFVFGAFNDETLVGIAGFYREKKNNFRHKGMIWGVFVVPEMRGKRIGRDLVEKALQAAENQPGLSMVKLQVAEPNFEAISLYKSLGFIEFGKEPSARRIGCNYISEILMFRPTKHYAR